MRASRFSKQAVLDDLDWHINFYEKEYRFIESDGSHQVEGKRIETIVAYGEYRAWCALRNRIEWRVLRTPSTNGS